MFILLISNHTRFLIQFGIGPLHDPVTWYKIKYTGEQVAQWDFQTKQLVPVHLDLPLFWKPHCATCSPLYLILYHVIGSCKGPINLHLRVFQKAEIALAEAARAISAFEKLTRAN